MRYYLHIYVDGHLELQSIHKSHNNATKNYIKMRHYYPSSTLGGKRKGVVTWEIIKVEGDNHVK